MLGADMDLSGKVVLVTGAQQGIGRAMALEFAAGRGGGGDQLARRRRCRREIAEPVRAAGRRAVTVQADVGADPAVQAMVGKVERELGPVDVLVNNAGVFPPRAVSRNDRKRLGLRARRQFQGRVFLRPGGGQNDGRGRPRRLDHQLDFGRGLSRLAARHPLLRQQGRRLVDDPADGARAGAATASGSTRSRPGSPTRRSRATA